MSERCLAVQLKARKREKATPSPNPFSRNLRCKMGSRQIQAFTREVGDAERLCSPDEELLLQDVIAFLSQELIVNPVCSELADG